MSQDRNLDLPAPVLEHFFKPQKVAIPESVPEPVEAVEAVEAVEPVKAD